MAYFTAETPHGNDHQREEYHGDEREFPVDQQQDGGKAHKGKDLAKKIRQPLGQRAADALDVVDHRGHQAAGGILLKKTDRLLDQLFVNLVAEVGDRSQADVLDDRIAEKLRQAFGQEEHHQGDGEDGPRMMDPGGEEIIEIDNALEKRNFDQGELRVVHAGLEDLVHHRDDHQGGQAFGRAD